MSPARSPARSTTFERGAAATTPLHSALFLAFAVLAVLRIALNNRILDLFMDYTADGGSLIEKIHPTFWGFAGIALVVLTQFRIELTRWELHVVRAILLVGALAIGLLIFGSITGHGSSLGYLLDTYVTLVPIVAIFAFPIAWRRQLGMLLLFYLVASAALGFVEYAFHIRLMPYTEGEPVFRPTGLTNHPLELGQWCQLALCLVAGLRWPPPVRFIVCAFLLLGCVISGARVATVVAFVCAVILLIAQVGAGRSPEQRLKQRTTIVLAILLVAPLLVGGLFAAGALSRFDGTTSDQNALSRVDIYSVLSLMSWNDLLLGGDIDAVRKQILEKFAYASIESSLLVFVVQFGLIGAFLFLAGLARLAQTMVRGTSLPFTLAYVSFFAIALTNNSLSVKSSSVFLVVLLSIVFREEATVAWEVPS